MADDRRERTREMLRAARGLSVLSLLDQAGVEHRRGQGWPCPVCGKSARSNGCGVWRGDACRWHCFGCGQGGTALDLWLLWKGLDPERLDAAALREVEALVEGSGSMPVVEVPVEVPLLTVEQVQAYWRRYQRGLGDPIDAFLLERGIPLSMRGHLGTVELTEWLPRERRGEYDDKPLIALPLRVCAEGRFGEVGNLVLRGGRSKAVTMNSGPGTTRIGGVPMCYGDPVRALSADVVMVVEGGPDWLTAQAIWPVRAVVGAFCADDLHFWHEWLKLTTGRVIFVPHLDGVQWRCMTCRGGWRKASKRALVGGRCPDCAGDVERRRVGIAAMDACMKQLGRGEWWPWREVLQRLGIGMGPFMERGTTDLNDLVRPDGWGVPYWRVRG